MQTRDTRLVAERIKAILDGDKREAARHFSERVEDKQRKRKLIEELKQVLRGKL